MVDYEWTVEMLDEDGDITEVFFADTFEEMLSAYLHIEGLKRMGVLRRVVVTECTSGNWRYDSTTDEEDRDYGYFDATGRLPEECDFGARLPAHIRKFILPSGLIAK
jgi:hypothetical protein